MRSRAVPRASPFASGASPRGCTSSASVRARPCCGLPRRTAPRRLRRSSGRTCCSEASSAPVTIPQFDSLPQDLLLIDQDTAAAELVTLRRTGINGDAEVVVGARLAVIDRLDGERQGTPLLVQVPWNVAVLPLMTNVSNRTLCT